MTSQLNGALGTRYVGVRRTLVSVGVLAAALLATTTGCRNAVRGEGPVAGSANASASNLSAQPLGKRPGGLGNGTPLSAQPGNELAAFAAGCFWGVEDAFRHVPGVVATAVGYTGGHTKSPDYEAVCSHTTGHAETVLIEYDPAKVSYGRLVNIFFQMHDPTTKNRQGPDVGDQYRSAIFTFSVTQAEAAKAELALAQPAQSKPIVTEITPVSAFYAAEAYHQQYTERTGVHGCPIHTFK
jgi:peptide-methionine (S)-S-oxide reductase